jgi:hypothetical protein
MNKIILIATLLITCVIANAQSTFSNMPDVIKFMENKTFYNSDLDIELEFGYISAYNTYGIKLKSNNNGNTSYFINCDVKAYTKYADISGLNPNSGENFKFRLYDTKVIVGVGEQRQYIFYTKNSSTVDNSSSTVANSSSNLSFYTGTYKTRGVQVVIKNNEGRLNAEVYKDGQVFGFKTEFGKISKFYQKGEPITQNFETDIFLVPNGCLKSGNCSTYILLKKTDTSYGLQNYSGQFILNIEFKTEEIKGTEGVKVIDQ